MSKKILILNGSPRKNGNTKALIESFTEGAKEAGHIVTIFNIHEMDIKHCTGCMAVCVDFKRKHCVQKDDMEKIYPVFEEADIIVFASPLYFWNFTAQLKMVIDRLQSPCLAGIGPKAAMLLSVAGDNEEMSIYCK